MASRLKSTIRQELLALQDASPDKILRPREVLAWAQANKTSAIYNALEWNNRKAAESWRLSQVRSLITLHITYADGSPQVISLSIDRTEGGGYRRMGDVMKVPDLRRIAVEDALRELERVRLKYQHIEELASIWDAIDGVKTTPGGKPPPPPGAPPPNRPRGGPKRGPSGGSTRKAPPRKKGPGPKRADIPPIKA